MAHSLPEAPAGVLTRPAEQAYGVFAFAVGLVVVGIALATAFFLQLGAIEQRITAVQIDVATIKGRLAEKHATND